MNTNAKRAVGRAVSIAMLTLGAASGCWATGRFVPVSGDGADAGSPSPVVEPSPADTAGQVSPTPDDSCLGIGQPSDGVRLEFFRLLNNHRQANGLSVLEYSVPLETAADGFAERLFRGRDVFFDHTSPEGDGPSDRALAAGFCHEYVGENLAWGRNTRTTAAEAFERLAASPSHNENMLLPDYRFVGVGFFNTVTEEGEWFFWVQDFAIDIRD